MIKDKSKYDIVKVQNDDVITITYTKKERHCDTCLKLTKSKQIRLIKYPILHKDMGRLIMSKKVCNDCYDDVKEVLDNLKYN